MEARRGRPAGRARNLTLGMAVFSIGSVAVVHVHSIASVSSLKVAPISLNCLTSFDCDLIASLTCARSSLTSFRVADSTVTAVDDDAVAIAADADEAVTASNVVLLGVCLKLAAQRLVYPRNESRERCR